MRIAKGARGARNYSQCDSLLIGDQCGAHTFPYLEINNSTARVEHEASTSKIGEDQLFYCRQRGLSTEDAINMIVSGFCKEVFRQLPMEFAVEAQKLLGVSLEGKRGMKRQGMNQMLKIINLHASAAGHEILRGVDLAHRRRRSERSRCLNGSGKSTLARVLAGHPEYQVTAGEIDYDGANLLAMDPGVARPRGRLHGVPVPG